MRLKYVFNQWKLIFYTISVLILDSFPILKDEVIDVVIVNSVSFIVYMSLPMRGFRNEFNNQILKQVDTFRVGILIVTVAVHHATQLFAEIKIDYLGSECLLLRCSNLNSRFRPDVVEPSCGSANSSSSNYERRTHFFISQKTISIYTRKRIVAKCSQQTSFNSGFSGLSFSAISSSSFCGSDILMI